MTSLYLRARETWSNRIDKPAAGGQVRDPAIHDQDLSKAAKSEPAALTRRKRI